MAANQDSEAPLSGAQVQALQKQLQETTRRILVDVELRKYALDQACKVSPEHPVETAKSMHAFLTAPASETTVGGG